jgi:predicted dehydrogenase
MPSSRGITDINRREFLSRSAAAAAIAAGVWSERAPAASPSPNEKLNVGCIGVGGKGWVDMNGCADENIAAICDVDELSLAKAQARFPKAQAYSDYRKMLQETSLDAVTISAPDHVHAPAALMAMRLGKHVYCQKPLAHTIEEARLLRQVAEEKKVATQMGNQGHSDADSRQSVEVLRAGAIGAVREVHVWTDRPIWPQGMDRPKETPAAPPSLHWDLWLGPAQERPYHPMYHPFGWRGFWEFGCGALGDMGCHSLDIAFWALDLGLPKSVEAESSGVNGETAPKSSIVRYEFSARGDLPPVKVVWYDGGRRPHAELARKATLGANGSLFIGEKGVMHVPGFWGKGKLLPEAEFADYQAPAPSLPTSPGHYAEWIAACKGGSPALSGFPYASVLTELVLLGNIALRLGRRFDWDAQNMKAINCPEADRFLRKEYRPGWEIR